MHIKVKIDGEGGGKGEKEDATNPKDCVDDDDNASENSGCCTAHLFDYECEKKK